MAYRIKYRDKRDAATPNAAWKTLPDTYDTYERACTVATALENRGCVTQIVPATDDTPASVERDVQKEQRQRY